MFSKHHFQPCAQLITAAFIMLALSVACSSAPSQLTLDGQTIFAANCSSCHTIGGGNLAGPDLKGVTQQQSEQWIANFISDPSAVLSSGDPTALKLLEQFNYVVMPNMGLTNYGVQAVIAYIRAESSLSLRPTSATTPGVSLLPGNAENGKAIFLGHVHLRNGAPFCVGCHNIDNTGILGGGTLGPNLTNTYAKYGDVGLDGILSNLPFLTMRPIYVNNSFTPQEKADIRAFMKSTVGTPTPNKEPLIIGISLAGFLAIMVFFAFAWRGRLRSVRRQLVEESQVSQPLDH